jgi:hypothetical protein
MSKSLVYLPIILTLFTMNVVLLLHISRITRPVATNHSRELRLQHRWTVGPAFDVCDNAVARSFARADVDDAVARAWHFWSSQLHDALALMPLANRPHAHFDMLGPVGPACPDLLVLGSGDGEKRICLSNVTGTSDCVIYSIGSNGQWDFEQDVYRRLPTCRVFTFDCTGDFVVPEAIKSRVSFHKLCVGAKDDGLFRTYSSLMKLLGHNTSPFHLKMDIEGWEYATLSNMIDSVPATSLPQQISVEIHYRTDVVPVPTFMRKYPNEKESFKDPGEIGTMMLSLFLRAGYVLVDRHDNPFCPHCSEILLAKLVC